MQSEAKAILHGVDELVRIREGIEDFRVTKGKIIPRLLTECEKRLKEWGNCIKEGVRIRCDIVPQIPVMWNWNERALFIVTVTNKTGYFQLEEVTVHLTSVSSKDGRAKVMREPCSPSVIRLPNIRPGGCASTQSPDASWCDGSPQTPARRGFTVLCTEVFQGTDTVVARALVTFRAVPYFEGSCASEEPIIGT